MPDDFNTLRLAQRQMLPVLFYGEDATGLPVKSPVIQKFKVTTDANGAATWMFARPFTVEPVIAALGQGVGSAPSIDVTSFTTGTDATSGATIWTAVSIKAYKGTRLPAVLTLLTNLINFDTAPPAPSVSINLWAGAPTQ